MTDKEKKTPKPKALRPTSATAAVPKATAPKKVTARSKISLLKASHEEIANLAHRYWTERGGEHGYDTEDWLRAERELLGKAS